MCVHLSNGLLQNNKKNKDSPGVNNGISGYYEIWWGFGGVLTYLHNSSKGRSKRIALFHFKFEDGTEIKVTIALAMSFS